MTTAPCPFCHSDVIVDDEAYEHDLFTCANCGKDSEIISVTPLALAAIPDEAVDDEQPL